MTQEIRVTHPDSSTETIPFLQAKKEEAFNLMDQATVTVNRDDLNNISVTEGVDEVYIVEDGTDQFGGILRNVVRGGPDPELVIDSFEKLAKDAKPTPSGQNYDSIDDTLPINDALGVIPDVNAGTVNNIASDLSFIFSHSSQAHKIRKVEEVTSGEAKYNADKTFDYANKLGSDKTNTTLSPASRKIVGDIKVAKNAGDEKVTHLRVLGSGEGKHQLSSEVIAPSYSQGDREVWRVFANTDIQDQDALDSMANVLIDEINTDHVEVNVALKDVDVSLGDEFHLTYNEEGIDRDLRVVELTTIYDTSGKTYAATLSTRQKSRTDDESKRRKDVERYNSAVQGTAVPINAGGGRQPVSSTVDYGMRLYYPAEVKYEHRLNVRVMGLPYRAYSEGVASGGDHTHSVDVTHPSHTHDVNHPRHSHDVDHPSHDHVLTVSGITSNSVSNLLGNDIASGFVSASSFSETENVPYGINQNAFAAVIIDLSSGGPVTELVIEDTTEGDTLYSQQIDGSSSNDLSVKTPIPTNVDRRGNNIQATAQFGSSSDGNFDLQVGIETQHDHDFSDSTTSDAALGTTQSSTAALGSTETSSAALGSTSAETSDASGPHTHDPKAGVIESFNGTVHYPENVDIKVNGTSQGTSFGDGTGSFEESVDIAGQLTEGQVNRIEATSDSLGHLMLYVEGDVYRQILGRG